MSVVNDMKGMIKREIAKRKIDNLFNELKEQERLVEDHLSKGIITKQTAAQFYRSAYNVGLKELNCINKEYNLKELGIDFTIIKLSLKQLKRKEKEMDSSLTV